MVLGLPRDEIVRSFHCFLPTVFEGSLGLGFAEMLLDLIDPVSELVFSQIFHRDLIHRIVGGHGKKHRVVSGLWDVGFFVLCQGHRRSSKDEQYEADEISHDDFQQTEVNRSQSTNQTTADAVFVQSDFFFWRMPCVSVTHHCRKSAKFELLKMLSFFRKT
ncbi:MAG: hypothetical protein RLZZ519_788 [Bacteroidota bacterium]|jgi:hypothetical protein